VQNLGREARGTEVGGEQKRMGASSDERQRMEASSMEARSMEASSEAPGPKIVFVAIHSARANAKLRATIRRTWVQRAREHRTLFEDTKRRHLGTHSGTESGSAIGWMVAYKFFVARSRAGVRSGAEAEVDNALKTEQMNHADMVTLGFIDDYRNLTLKSSGSAHYASTMLPRLVGE
jgi:hypothetical protein